MRSKLIRASVGDVEIFTVEKRTRGVGKSNVTVRVGLIMDVT